MKIELIGFAKVTRDLTERKQAEIALRESEKKFRLLMEAAPEAIVITNAEGEITLVNIQAETLFGYNRTELVGQSVEMLIPQHFHERHVEHRVNYMAAPRVRPMGSGLEVFARRKDGSEFPVEIELSYVEAQAGLLVMSFVADITERKQIAAALEQQRTFLQEVIDGSPSMIFVKDYDARFVLVNPKVAEMYNTTVGEMIGKSDADFNPSLSEVQDFLEADRRVIDSGEPLFIEEPITSFTGETHWLQTTKVPIISGDGITKYVLGIATDITARKRAEQALQAKMEEELTFQNYLKELHEITIDLAQIDHLDDFYKRAVELGLERLGFERLALFLYDEEDDSAVGTYGTNPQGKVVNERHLRFIPGPEGSMRRALETAERFSFDEVAPLRENLEEIGSGWNAAAVLRNGTQSLGWLVADNFIHQKPASKLLLDVLALYALTIGTLLPRKQIQMTLRESEERFRQIAENIDQVLFIRSSDDQKMLYINPMFETLSGKPGESLYENPNSFIEIVHPEDRDFVLQQFYEKHYIEEGFSDFEYRIIPSNGLVRWVRARTFPIRGDDGSILRRAGVIEDITRRKSDEETLKQALEHEKDLNELKSRFVSMASHEFRTPLATILAMTETLTAYRQQMQDDQIEKRLRSIREQVDHLKDIMDDVLQLARLQARRVEFNPVMLDLDSLCRSVIDEFQSRPDITHPLLYSCDVLLQEAKLDKKLMRQILNNLVSNAVKYSPEGKPITISLDYRDQAIVLQVRDQGIGIPEGDLKHLFEPFHRAANVGAISGTGLGLVITKESVELHRGTIHVESVVDTGTTFTVTIPVVS